jgi:hypothetical protein
VKFFLIFLIFICFLLADHKEYNSNTLYDTENAKINIFVANRKDNLNLTTSVGYINYNDLSSKYIALDLVSSKNFNVDMTINLGYGTLNSGELDSNGTKISLSDGDTHNIDISFSESYYFNYFSTKFFLGGSYNSFNVSHSLNNLNAITYDGKMGIGLNILITNRCVVDFAINGSYGKYDIQTGLSDNYSLYSAKSTGYDLKTKLSFLITDNFYVSAFYELSKVEFNGSSKEDNSDTVLNILKLKKEFIGLKFEFVLEE